MNTLDRWLASQYRQKKHAVFFYQALLSVYIFPYAWSKMRIFIYNQAISVIVNIIEFYLLTTLLCFPSFAIIILLKSALLLVSNTWWGALEILRTRVSYFDQMEQQDRIHKEINCWMVFSYIVASVPLIGSVYCIASIFVDHMTSNQILLRTIISALLLESSLSIVQQTYASAVTTLHVLRRPFYTYWIPQALYLLLLASIWPVLKTFTLPVGYLFSSILNLIYLFYFTFHSYRIYSMEDIQLPSKQTISLFFKNLWSRELMLASLASFSIGIGGILIWIAFYSSFTNAPSENQKTLFLLLYFVSPLINTSSNWSSLFYYDFKQYKEFLKDFIQKFHAQLLSISIMMGIVCWLIATVLLLGYFGKYANSFSLIFLFFFLLKSTSSYLQIYAFCFKKYIDVIVSNFFIIIGFVILLLLKQTILIQLFILILFMTLGFLYIRRVRARSLSWQGMISKKTLQFNEWLSSLATTLTPVRVEKIKLCAITTRLQQKTFLLSLYEKINKIGKIALVNHNHIFYYTEFSGNDDHSVETTWLMQYGAGLIEEYKVLSPCRDGREALRLAYDKCFLLNNIKPRFFDIDLANINSDGLLALFVKYFPYGKCIYLSKNKLLQQSETIEDFPHEDIAKQFIRYMSSPLDSDANAKQVVTMIHDQHQIPVIFVIPRAYENRKIINRWVQLIYQYMIIKFIGKDYFIVSANS